MIITGNVNITGNSIISLRSLNYLSGQIITAFNNYSQAYFIEFGVFPPSLTNYITDIPLFSEILPNVTLTYINNTNDVILHLQPNITFNTIANTYVAITYLWTPDGIIENLSTARFISNVSGVHDMLTQPVYDDVLPNIGTGVIIANPTSSTCTYILY